MTPRKSTIKKQDSTQKAIKYSPTTIHIKGARGNNLKNVELHIPKNQLIVVTGVSGSGKSSITMDTLYAEGQRRYVESLSSYARQFLMRMKKPEVDFIKGICPAIAIEQKVASRNARSTVGSLTEIYDFLRLLFARIGKTISPISGNIVSKDEVSTVVDYIEKTKDNTKIRLLTLLQIKEEQTIQQALSLLLQKGFTRVILHKETVYIEDILELIEKGTNVKADAITVLIDRFAVKQHDKENSKRIADSVQTAFLEGGGSCIVEILDKKTITFNNRFELDGILFEEPSQHLFNYNNPYGACKVCEGFGQSMGIDPDKVFPNKSLSIYEGAIACWKGEKLSKWNKQLIKNAAEFDFPIHRPYYQLSEIQKELLWAGNKYFKGINAFFQMLEESAYKIQNRVLMARYRGRRKCESCKGARLRKEALYVQISGSNIYELTAMPLKDLKQYFESLKLSTYDYQIAKRIIFEIQNRLNFMLQVGLGYLTLGRASNSLSGGETQRINLTRTLGSNLTSSMYILDEPSIGLHPKDTDKLIAVLKKLRDLGNTVIVVEHEEDVISQADYLVDMGPRAGIHGGEIVFAGAYERIHKEAIESLTAAYMSGRKIIPIPEHRRKVVNKILLSGARQHNLKSIDVTFPLNALTVVTGVSGSGKTTLVKQILYPLLKKHIDQPTNEKIGDHDSIEGDLNMIQQVELVNQNAIGRSSRSNPVTYVKAYDYIRKLFANQQNALVKGFKSKHFSFNVEGGRCEECKGDGNVVIEMQFLADVKLECDICKGQRFKKEVLEVTYNGKNINEVLNLSIEEALIFFKNEKEIVRKIKALDDVGLGYIKLGQSSDTLSGGEAQRVKLAAFLNKERSRDKVFFVFDEPTTGLHFHDINKLLTAFNALVERGHTVLVIEHNMEVIKSADWIIDLGPEGGEYGGQLMFEGVPEDILNCKQSHTATYLAEKLST